MSIFKSDQNLQDYNRRLIEEFRANGGQVTGVLKGVPLILLATKGAKSGQARVSPLIAVPDGDSYLAVAAKGGAPQHPFWYHNLVAHPNVTVETGSETFAATARLLTGEERDQAFAKAVAVFALFDEYQKKAAREIPLFSLERL